MSCSDRRRVLAGLAVLPLAGCFRPMLAEDTAGGALRNRISFPTYDDRFGYFLNESLEDRLGRTGDALYRLEIITTLGEQGIAITQDNAVTRITMTAEAIWTLRRRSDSAALLSDKVRVQSGYSATTSLFATRQTRLDIERRLARDIGERISRVILAQADAFGS